MDNLFASSSLLSLLLLLLLLVCPLANCFPSIRSLPSNSHATDDEHLHQIAGSPHLPPPHHHHQLHHRLLPPPVPPAIIPSPALSSSAAHLHPSVNANATTTASPLPSDAGNNSNNNDAAAVVASLPPTIPESHPPMLGHPLLPHALHDPMPPTQEESRKENLVVEVDVSPGFVRAAELFKQSVDERVDPCEDFFEFACGKWVANNQIPKDLTSYGHFSELREKVNDEMRVLFEDPKKSSSRAINQLKQLYRGCMDAPALNVRKSTELLKKVERFGHWPIIAAPGKWHPANFDLTRLLVDVGRSRAIDVFVDVYVSLDQKNVTRRLLNFDQGGLGLGSGARDYYLNETRYGKQMAAYANYMTQKIHSFAVDAGVAKSKSEIAREVSKLIEFEKEFARILTPDEERRNFTKMYNVRHLSDMQQIFGLMNWTTYFDWLVPEDMRPYLAADPEIILSEPEFFDRLTALLRRTDPRVLANYVLWRYASAWSFQLDERYDDIQQDFLREFLGKQAKSPRWKDCSSAAASRMSYASGAMYVRKHFNRNSKAAALDMIKDLRVAFRGMLGKTDWMDEGTKEYAMEKAEQMLSLIGYPDFLYNDTQLDKYYENFTLAPDDHYALMVEKSSIWAQKKAFRRLIEEVDREEFGTSSAVVNAFYSGVKNAITFPAAILQAPFFDHSFPKAVNYGGIGAVIGHEITHGFDDQGAQFDGRGNLKDWWDPSTQSRFVERKKCIIDQYSSFEVPNTSSHVNGILTQGENIADNGGIKQAFHAYQSYLRNVGGEEKRLPGFERYTNEQVFFISYAQTWCGHSKSETLIRQILTDPHSPYRYRVNGVVVNQPEFAQAFSCPVGAPMNPERRCAVW